MLLPNELRLIIHRIASVNLLYVPVELPYAKHKHDLHEEPQEQKADGVHQNGLLVVIQAVVAVDVEQADQDCA